MAFAPVLPLPGLPLAKDCAQWRYWSQALFAQRGTPPIGSLCLGFCLSLTKTFPELH